MSIRIAKLLLTASLAAYLGLIVLNNLTDYDTNLAFVQHVLAMDSVFPDSTLRDRALLNPLVAHFFYGVIVAWQALAALLCALGVVRLARRLRNPAEFEQAKDWAVAGVLGSCLLWLLAFLVVGGEWFAMWQSREWNAQPAALRMFTVSCLVLLVLMQRDTG